MHIARHWALRTLILAGATALGLVTIASPLQAAIPAPGAVYTAVADDGKTAVTVTMHASAQTAETKFTVARPDPSMCGDPITIDMGTLTLRAGTDSIATRARSAIIKNYVGAGEAGYRNAEFATFFGDGGAFAGVAAWDRYLQTTGASFTPDPADCFATAPAL